MNQPEYTRRKGVNVRLPPIEETVYAVAVGTANIALVDKSSRHHRTGICPPAASAHVGPETSLGAGSRKHGLKGAPRHDPA